MALPPILSDKTRELVEKAKVFVVGAGGIGCEVLKNLALSGFTDIEIVSVTFKYDYERRGVNLCFILDRFRHNRCQ